ncbi:hypothetical protein AAFG22_14855 [Bradyrhizobium sp. B024]|uniref:hypothetical protein n=1 Tax=Bradyrhizobium sp. B024 TaxID=3140247 RepID=UPI003182F0DC
MGANKITGMADPTVATDGATKNYVDTSVAAFFSTGDIKPTFKTVADSGWVMAGNSVTIGNVGSGASYANANALALYTLIWNNISSPTANAYCPVIGGIGASAAADWAGLKPLSTGFFVGHALGVAGSGGSMTTRTLGSDLRNETVTLGTTNLPAYTPAGSVATTSTPTVSGVPVIAGTGNTAVSPSAATQVVSGTLGTLVVTSVSTFTGTAQGGTSAPVSIMQPTIWVNVMIKL